MAGLLSKEKFMKKHMLKDVRVLRLPSVQACVGLSRSSVYAKLDPNSTSHDPTFPRPVRLGGERSRAVGWLAADVEAWIAGVFSQKSGQAVEGGAA